MKFRDILLFIGEPEASADRYFEESFVSTDQQVFLKVNAHVLHLYSIICTALEAHYVSIHVKLINSIVQLIIAFQAGFRTRHIETVAISAATLWVNLVNNQI